VGVPSVAPVDAVLAAPTSGLVGDTIFPHEMTLTIPSSARAPTRRLRAGLGALWRVHWPVAPLLTVYLALAVVYGAVVPLWEAPDEPEHLEYVRHLVQRRALPAEPLRSVQIEPNDESGQAPLYYALVAVATRRLDFAGLDLVQRNPYQKWQGHPARLAMLEPTRDAGWPWRGAALAAHRARAVSALFGALAVLCVYATAVLLRKSGGPSPLLAAGLLALNPAFLFSSGTVSNDSAVAATGAAVVLIAVWTMTRPVCAGVPWVFGAAIGLALLAKANAALLAPFAVAALIASASSRRDAVVRIAKATSSCVLVAGWWFAWNLVEFGTPVRKEAERLLSPSASLFEGLSPELLRIRLWSIYRSTWGLFGWANVEMAHWAYLAFGLASALALAGLVLRARSERWWRPNRESIVWPWLSLLVAAAYGTVLGRGIITAGIGTDHARFTYPAVAASALLFAAGVEWLAGRARLRWLPLPVLGLTTALAVTSPWAYILPAYPAPLPVWRGIEPLGLAPGGRAATLAGPIELAGIVPPDTPGPGTAVSVTLYWRVRNAPDRELHSFVHVLDESGKGWAQSDRVAGGDEYPSRTWLPGDLVEDTHAMVLPHDIPTGRYRLVVGLYEWPSLRRLAVTESSRPVTDDAIWAGDLDVRVP